VPAAVGKGVLSYKDCGDRAAERLPDDTGAAAEVDGGLQTVVWMPKQLWLSATTVAVSTFPGVVGTDSRGRLVLVHG